MISIEKRSLETHNLTDVGHPHRFLESYTLKKQKIMMRKKILQRMAKKNEQLLKVFLTTDLTSWKI